MTKLTEPKNKLFYWVWRVSKVSLISYIAVLTFLYSIQNLLVFPGRSTQGKAEANFIPPKGTELVKLTTKTGDKIVALWGQALDPSAQPLSDAQNKPTMIYFYGNGMCLKECLIEFQRFRMLGVNVIIPEYVGYGLSSGSASEQNCYATSEVVYEYLLTTKEVNPGKIIISGWSLGSAVAIDLASKKAAAGLVTFSAFTSMIDMARQLYPFLPIPKFILVNHFANKEKISNIKCPVFISHGKADDLIPWQMSQSLAKLVEGSKTEVYIDGIDHIIFLADDQKLLKVLGEFLQRL
ncbi:MAG: alpha/beta hydrolase [Blastocatellia bacterium]|nr:alpha/beta hydrolase [Blastocatellia bacterium]MBN8723729.1 alpha/beta hydrolase [Acidobacteriota bacterium]